MAITPRTASAASTISGKSALSIPAPSMSLSDILLWTYVQGAAAVVAPATPSGWGIWQPWASVGTSVQLGAITWYKFNSGSEPASYDLAGLTSGRHAGYVMPYGGVDQTTPKDVANPATVSSATNHPALPSITPVTPGAYVLGFSADNSGTGVINTTYSTSTPNGVVDAQTTSTATGTTNCACGEMHVPWVSGSVVPVLTPSGTIPRALAYTSALRPAASPVSYGTFMPYFV